MGALLQDGDRHAHLGQIARQEQPGGPRSNDQHVRVHPAPLSQQTLANICWQQ